MFQIAPEKLKVSDYRLYKVGNRFAYIVPYDKVIGFFETQRAIVIFDGIRKHSSILEAKRCIELLRQQEAGEILNLETHVKFDLGKTSTGAHSFRADFRFQAAATGQTIVEEVKSSQTIQDRRFMAKQERFNAMHPNTPLSIVMNAKPQNIRQEANDLHHMAEIYREVFSGRDRINPLTIEIPFEILGDGILAGYTATQFSAFTTFALLSSRYGSDWFSIERKELAQLANCEVRHLARATARFVKDGLLRVSDHCTSSKDVTRYKVLDWQQALNPSGNAVRQITLPGSWLYWDKFQQLQAGSRRVLIALYTSERIADGDVFDFDDALSGVKGISTADIANAKTSLVDLEFIKPETGGGYSFLITPAKYAHPSGFGLQDHLREMEMRGRLPAKK